MPSERNCLSEIYSSQPSLASGVKEFGLKIFERFIVEELVTLVEVVIWLELDLAGVGDWDREKDRDNNSWILESWMGFEMVLG